METHHGVKTFRYLEFKCFQEHGNWKEQLGTHPPAIPGSWSTSLSVAVRSKCSAASATKETPAIAAFSHFLYAADEITPVSHPAVTRPRKIMMLQHFLNMKIWENSFYYTDARVIRKKVYNWGGHLVLILVMHFISAMALWPNPTSTSYLHDSITFTYHQKNFMGLLSDINC